jgi:hypothetical protein
MKARLAKGSKNMRWALSEYIANISNSEWNKPDSIRTLLKLRDLRRQHKQLLFSKDIVADFRAHIAKSSLYLNSLRGRKKVWKPTRYIPSRNVVLANSIEELNNLYKVDTISQFDKLPH